MVRCRRAKVLTGRASLQTRRDVLSWIPALAIIALVTTGFLSGFHSALGKSAVAPASDDGAKPPMTMLKPDLVRKFTAVKPQRLSRKAANG